MPITFPIVRRGNTFDRWLWQRGAKSPQQQNAPNLARPGQTFNDDNLHPGIPKPRSAVNLRTLGRMYQHGGSPAVVNPAALLFAAKRIADGNVIAVYGRSTGTVRMQMAGVTRDSAGIVLKACVVMLFRTVDNSFVASTVSDAGTGAWTLDVMAGGGAFFLVCYKAGGTDVAGTSLNTLQPVAV